MIEFNTSAWSWNPVKIRGRSIEIYKILKHSTFFMKFEDSLVREQHSGHIFLYDHGSSFGVKKVTFDFFLSTIMKLLKLFLHYNLKKLQVIYKHRALKIAVMFYQIYKILIDKILREFYWKRYFQKIKLKSNTFKCRLCFKKIKSHMICSWLRLSSWHFN